MKWLLLLALFMPVNDVVDCAPNKGKHGTEVTIHVTDLKRNTVVLFDKYTAERIVLDMKTGTITCKAPNNYGKLGKVDIIIITPSYPRTVIKDGFEYKE